MTLEILTSDLLGPIHHGFFTRRGGASSGIFQGLNCGLGSSDQREAVSLNRARVAEAMRVAPAGLVGVHQVHSPDVAVITGPTTDQSHTTDTPPHPASDPTCDRTRADAMVTKTPGVALAILTADCQPVLFADHEAGVIGAAHAGWRGALDGVLEATLDAMEALGADRANTHAVIGPAISQRAYEVGPEFFEDFLQQDPSHARFFANGEGDRFLFDLPGLGLHLLRQAGIGQADWTRHCTYSDPDRFYSYRRTTHAGEADYGRLISCITL